MKSRNIILPFSFIVNSIQYVEGNQGLKSRYSSSKFKQSDDVSARLTNKVFSSLSSIPTIEEIGHDLTSPSFTSVTTRSEDSDSYEPIRFLFNTDKLNEQVLSSSNQDDAIEVQVLIDEILPKVHDIFSRALSLVPGDGYYLSQSMCFGLFDVPTEYTTEGIYGYDTILFMSAYDSISDGSETINLCPPGVLAAATPCAFDSLKRPVVGMINICLGMLPVVDGKISNENKRRMVDIVVHELCHVLGINSDMLQYYRHKETGSLLTPPDSTYKGSIPCVNGNTPIEGTTLPCENTIKAGKNAEYYELTLPTVTQVARNQFGCQSLTGARLENQPTNIYDCFGSHLDERLFFTDLMSAVYDEDAAFFTPLMLALFEDSGFYRANFTQSVNSPFGLGAGCEFVNEDCSMVNTASDDIPSYFDGYFCSAYVDDPWECGPANRYRGQYCNIFSLADQCPIIYSSLDVDCDDLLATKIHEYEVFGADSKCMRVTDTDSNERKGICVESFCNMTSQTLDFVVDGNTYSCPKSYPKHISIGSSIFTCPRLQQSCPDMFCPSMCSGKGTCDWSLEIPKCKCFDPTDTTDGCYNSALNNNYSNMGRCHQNDGERRKFRSWINVHILTSLMLTISILFPHLL